MTYQFPPDLHERVHSHMVGGEYQDEDDLLRQALDALDEREQRLRQRWDERNASAIEQSRMGLSKPLDLDDLLDRVEQRVAQLRHTE